MREILFRGKSDDNGKWKYGFISGKHVYTTDDDGNVVNIDTYWMGYGNTIVKANTVGQFTGLTDKNGTKIFEGDIVKCKHEMRFAKADKDLSKIRYAYDGVLFERDTDELFVCEGECYCHYEYFRNYAVEYYYGNLRLHNKSVTHELTRNYKINHDIEVIGNIHDNPELLEVKE